MKIRFLYYVLFLILLTVNSGFSQLKNIDFDSTHWDLSKSKTSEYLGRTSLMGTASLKDAQFENGVIEVDLAVNGERSYPGIIFRQQNQKEYERVYIRPHLGKTFQNVIQYVGTFNGIDSWQLFNGEGYTAGATFPFNQWFHVKNEVKGSQARLFINNSEKPSLYIKNLAHDISKGTLGLMGPMDGSAYFSNFSYRLDDNLDFPSPQKIETPLGIISDWELSKVFKYSEVDIEKLPTDQGIKDLGWKKIQSLPTGLVDISRHFGRQGNEPDIIWAKTVISSDKDHIKQYAFGYSDYITIFLNGKTLFAGNSAYTQRDPSFQGIVGLNDYIYLPLKKGKNELVICVYESFGGWAFIFQDVNAIFQDKRITKQWEIVRKFKYPESVVYDSKRDRLYISNYFNNGNEFISKIKCNGEIEQLEWVKGVRGPTGLCIFNDNLYVVGRMALVEVDIESGTIKNRYPFPKPKFPNDVTVDSEGNFYITDSQNDAIYKLSNGKYEEWFKGDEIKNPNGILVDGEKLLIGTSGDAGIKIIDLKTKKISNLISLSAGSIMDGLRKDGKGNYLISDHKGRIFKVTPAGNSELLLDSRVPQKFTADFEYIPEKKLFVIPTLEDNRIVTYKMDN